MQKSNLTQTVHWTALQNQHKISTLKNDTTSRKSMTCACPIISQAVLRFETHLVSIIKAKTEANNALYFQIGDNQESTLQKHKNW